MNDKKFSILEKQQSSIARKVLNAVPIEVAWPVKTIASELARQGQVRDLSLITGCLDTLKDAGLVHEPIIGFFKRVKTKAKSIVEKEEVEPMDMNSAAERLKSNEPIDRLSVVATKLRGLAQVFIELSNEIDEAALTFEEKASGNVEELAKLQQLKGLLKSLS